MSCFWRGLIKKLRQKDFINKPKTPEEFLAFLQRHNEPTPDVLINGRSPTKKQMIENMKWVSLINQTNNGYDCSTFDPVLMLVCHLFNVKIIHHYNGINIIYQKSSSPARASIRVFSNTNHFW